MITTFENVRETENANVLAILQDMFKDGDSVANYYTVEDAISAFNCEGPYCMAERLGLLVNKSAEDMAIDFMTYINSMYPNTY